MTSANPEPWESRHGASPSAGFTERRSSGIHPLEISLVVLVGVHLCFLSWAFGGVDLWCQRMSCVLGFLSLVVALRPRHSRTNGSQAEPARRDPWRKLWRFPVFWAGLLLFGYVAIQAVNPAFSFHRDSSRWWLERQPFIAWLPSGIPAPLSESNPLRTLMLWFPAWTTACALWAGIAHRRTACALLVILAINGFVFAVFGILQKAGGVEKIYGARVVESGNFLAAMIYANHGAAYFNLVTAVCLALAIDTFARNLRSPGRAGPAILYFLFGTISLAVTGLSLSLGGVTILALLLLLVVPVAIWHLRPLVRSAPGTRAGLFVAATLLILAGAIGVTVMISRFEDRLRSKLADNNGRRSAQTRWDAAQRGIDMLSDHWLLGWGAGGFRYGFTKYDRDMTLVSTGDTRRYFWEHLHDDWLEWLIELGVLGFAPIVFSAGWFLKELWRQRVWLDPAQFALAVGLLLLAVYACMDFPLQNPAILSTAAALSVLAFQWKRA
jgi:O-antigen ligase